MARHEGRKYCLICQSNHYSFDGFGNTNSNNIVGSSFRDNNVCPSCLSFDRYRLMYHYLIFKENFLFIRNKKILYIAPEFQILEVILNNSSLTIITGDIKIMNVDCIFNIEELCFRQDSFDYVICNHVLSHVDNDDKAIDEVYRVLNTGGKLILTVPINKEIFNTVESSEIDEAMRVPITGSDDHRRAYGINFIDDLEKNKFSTVNYYNFFDENGEDLCSTYCINQDENIFIATK